MTVYCDCHGPPWPAMMRLHVGGYLSRYYLCRKCGTIREDECRVDGTITGTRFHDLGSVDLPAVAVEEARALLEGADYDQLSLFGADW